MPFQGDILLVAIPIDIHSVSLLIQINYNNNMENIA